MLFWAPIPLLQIPKILNLYCSVPHWILHQNDGVSVTQASSCFCWQNTVTTNTTKRRINRGRIWSVQRREVISFFMRWLPYSCSTWGTSWANSAAYKFFLNLWFCTLVLGFRNLSPIILINFHPKQEFISRWNMYWWVSNGYAYIKFRVRI